MQENIYCTKDVKKIKTCSCGAVEGKKTILNNFAHIGVNTRFQGTGVFKDNRVCYVENNFCPQCGKKYAIVKE